MIISPGRRDITWWINNALINEKNISHGVPSHVLKTDAPNEEWGLYLRITLPMTDHRLIHSPQT